MYADLPIFFFFFFLILLSIASYSSKLERMIEEKNFLRNNPDKKIDFSLVLISFVSYVGAQF